MPLDFKTARFGRSCRVSIVALVAVAAIVPRGFAAAPGIRTVMADEATRTSAAVVVDGSKPLVHTAQLLPLDDRGKLVGAGRADEQASKLLDRLEATLREAGSGLDRLVKLNVYAARLEALPPFRDALKRRMAENARPAISVVVGTLTDPDALLALDAVAVADQAATAGRARRAQPSFAVLPPGRRVYVSGQADPDPDLARATRLTLEGLGKTLAYLKLRKEDVVQLKAFLQPAAGAEVVAREVSAFFGSTPVPPLVFVEWRSGATQPIEIELVAGGGQIESAKSRTEPETLEYLTPPALKPSPVFSRVARVDRGDLIYVSGLHGPAGAGGPAQVEAIFGALEHVLADAGSDLRHLAKATYYVSDEPASRALNELRPKYYDPKRPPAASKAMVAGVGAEGRTVTLDMIAVPVPAAAGRSPE